MLSKLLQFLLLVTLALFMFQCDNSEGADDEPDTNLVVSGTWEVSIDDCGSTISAVNGSGTTISNNFVTNDNGEIHVTMTRIQQPVPDQEPWPYVQLFCGLASDYFEGMEGVEFAYKSSHPLALGLPMTGKTDDNGAEHRVVLDPTTDWDTVQIALVVNVDTAFSQPEWAAAEGLTEDLVLNEVCGFSLVHEFEPYNITANMTLDIQILRAIEKLE